MNYKIIIENAILPAGEVAEWLKRCSAKALGESPRGFESHPLRY